MGIGRRGHPLPFSCCGSAAPAGRSAGTTLLQCSSPARRRGAEQQRAASRRSSVTQVARGVLAGGIMKRVSVSGSWFSRRSAIIALGLAVVATGTLVLVSHKAHLSRLLALLPYAGILLCPLMHVFMHKGHGGHGENATHGGRGSRPPEDE